MLSDSRPTETPADAKRWVFVALGLAINICLGTVYSWSVFKKPFEEQFNVGATVSGLPFMVFLAFFATLVPLTGRFLERYGPRTVTLVGAAFVGIGWILAGFANNVATLTFFYGVVAGAGVGIVYGAPVAVSTRWLPDKRGLAVGLTLVGFGMSPLVTAPLARMLIEQHGLQETFRLLGFGFLTVIGLLALPLRFPPADWRPQQSGKPSTASAFNFSPLQMLKTPSFYVLWLCYVFGTLVGLMAIGISSPVGQEVIGLTKAQAAAAVSLFAVFNGLGRPLFGWLTDRIKPRAAAILSYVIILLASLAMMGAAEGRVALYLVCFACFWLCVGGWLAIVPASVAIFFGTQHHAKNYGVAFTGYGVGAILGTVISGRIRDIFGTYLYAFIPTALLAVVGIILASLLLKPPVAPHEPKPEPAERELVGQRS